MTWIHQLHAEFQLKHPALQTLSEVQRSRKRRECQFTPCGNKSVSSWQNCVKVCCGRHTFEKMTIVTCKNVKIKIEEVFSCVSIK